MAETTQALASREQRFEKTMRNAEKFFQTAGRTFNAEFFPSTTVTATSSTTGVIETLGVRFEVDVRMLVVPPSEASSGVPVPLDVLEVSLPADAHNPKQRLVYRFIDGIGNVRTEVHVPSTLYVIDEKDFVVHIVDEAQRAYFAKLHAALP